MSNGQLRADVENRFGDLLERSGFKEVDYFFDAKAFGNEILDLSDHDGVNVRITRDRGQIFFDMMGSNGLYVPVHLLLEILGHPRTAYNYADAAGIPRSGMPDTLVRDLIEEWPRIVALAKSSEMPRVTFSPIIA